MSPIFADRIEHTGIMQWHSTPSQRKSSLIISSVGSPAVAYFSESLDLVSGVVKPALLTVRHEYKALNKGYQPL